MSDSRRLFFALWPDPGVRDAIAGGIRSWGIRGRVVDPAKLHMTLVFLGQVGADRIERLVQDASAIECPPFDLQLGRIGYFERPRIAWLAPVSQTPVLERLAVDLRSLCTDAGIEIAGRRFRPHVTLARKAERPQRLRLPKPITWRVERFNLTESRTTDSGSVYRDLCSWRLADTGPAPSVK